MHALGGGCDRQCWQCSLNCYADAGAACNSCAVALPDVRQAFRKAIGVRIKEETEIIEGEVSSAHHTLHSAVPHCAQGCQRLPAALQSPHNIDTRTGFSRRTGRFHADDLTRRTAVIGDLF